MLPQVSGETALNLPTVYGRSMNESVKTAAARADLNVLNRLGVSLRKATEAVLSEELPEEIRRLLRELELKEASGMPPSERPEGTSDT
jgi:hypothetical protein